MERLNLIIIIIDYNLDYSIVEPSSRSQKQNQIPLLSQAFAS